MASSSKKLEPETEEERQARRRVIESGITFGGARDEYAGREIMMNRDGSNGFTFQEGFGAAQDPQNQYKWNEKTGDYRSHGGGVLRIGEVAPVQASSGGGGGGNTPNPDNNAPPGTVVKRPGDTNQIVAGGDQIVNSQMMYDWRPTARNSNGGGAYNPLVNPVNWLHNPEPIKVRNMGTYIVNKKKAYNGGLL